MEEDCDQPWINGAAFGLCNAYCEAMDCDCRDGGDPDHPDCEPNANERACDRVRDRFIQWTERDLPCEGETTATCPCGVQELATGWSEPGGIAVWAAVTMSSSGFLATSCTVDAMGVVTLEADPGLGDLAISTITAAATQCLATNPLLVVVNPPATYGLTPGEAAACQQDLLDVAAAIALTCS